MGHVKRGDHPDGVTVTEVRSDVGVAEARSRFGGFDLPASLAGALVALATLTLLASLIAGGVAALIAEGGFSRDDDTVSVASVVATLTTVFLAFLCGGWAAARMARYDGVRNALATVLWFLLIMAALAAIGAWLGDEYDVLPSTGLPAWLTTDEFESAGIIAGIGAIISALVGAALGGRIGERYHRRADASLASVRPGGVFRHGDTDTEVPR